MNYDGVKLNPLFYSELPSSHLLYDIFDNHPEITTAFIKNYFGVEAKQVMVTRERSYPKKGSIDIFIEFKNLKLRCALLIEIKVHDYLSVTEHQIGTYYDAVKDDGVYDQVYFIFLTQFNDQTGFENIIKPKSLAEAARGRDLIGDNFLHLSWKELHQYFDQYKPQLSREQQLMLDLQRNWITEKTRADLLSNVVETGERTLKDYFGDIEAALNLLEPLGETYSQNNRLKLRIDTARLDEKKLNFVLDGIKLLGDSDRVNRKKLYRMGEQTLQAAEEFLSELAVNREWWLLSFYAALFQYARDAEYLQFYGTGTSGFSIKVEIKGKGEISLCTLYRSKVIDFSLKR